MPWSQKTSRELDNRKNKTNDSLTQVKNRSQDCQRSNERLKSSVFSRASSIRTLHLLVPCVYNVQGVEVQALLDDVRKLKIIAKGHERRIKYLEDRLAAYEDVAASIDDHNDEQME